MTDKRKHRGPHPGDARLFAAEHQAALRDGVADLSWLLSRGYAPASSLKLVGDRYALAARQRQAVARSSCSDADAARRRSREQPATALHDAVLLIDGFNVLTTIETALSGGVILPCRDACLRDIAGIHGNYRVLEETRPALMLIHDELAALGARHAHWYFDRSVSNSGRIKALLTDLARARPSPPVTVELVGDPDPILAAASEIVATSDSAVLDACSRWFNLARHLIEKCLPSAKIIPLS